MGKLKITASDGFPSLPVSQLHLHALCADQGADHILYYERWRPASVLSGAPSHWFSVNIAFPSPKYYSLLLFSSCYEHDQQYLQAPLVAQTVKNLPSGDSGLIRKIPWRKKEQPTLEFLPGELHGQKAWWAAVHGVAKS